MHDSFDLAQGAALPLTPVVAADGLSAAAAASVSTADDVRDRALVDRVAQGDEVAFEQLVRAHRPRLLRIAERIVDPGRAEDAVQNALLKAYQQFRAGDAAPKSPSAWLNAITRNAAIDQLRRRGPVDPVAEPASTLLVPPTEAVAESRAELRRVLGDVAALPEHEREALLLRATTGAGHDEIGEHLSVSPGQARQLLHRARRRLREVAAVLLPAWLAFRVSQAKAAVGGFASSAPLESLGGGRAVAVGLAAVATVGGGGVAVQTVRHHDAVPAKAVAPLAHSARPAAANAAAASGAVAADADQATGTRGSSNTASHADGRHAGTGKHSTHASSESASAGRTDAPNAAPATGTKIPASDDGPGSGSSSEGDAGHGSSGSGSGTSGSSSKPSSGHGGSSDDASGSDDHSASSGSSGSGQSDDGASGSSGSSGNTESSSDSSGSSASSGEVEDAPSVEERQSGSGSREGLDDSSGRSAEVE